MRTRLKQRQIFNKHGKSLVLFCVSVFFFILFAVSSFKPINDSAESPENFGPYYQDSIASKKAFLKVYKVLMSPRCMNCHPSGDIPLQGEDSHLHQQNVKRGPNGKGLYALKCANCHQRENIPGPHMPPGNSKWALPPSNMKMVFQGRTPRQLASQLLDRKTNGGKSVKALIDHISRDSLVLGGWNPPEGLSQPPLSHAEFVRAFNEWIKNGAFRP